jgi:hypothetical protein
VSTGEIRADVQNGGNGVWSSRSTKDRCSKECGGIESASYGREKSCKECGGGRSLKYESFIASLQALYLFHECIVHKSARLSCSHLTSYFLLDHAHRIHSPPPSQPFVLCRDHCHRIPMPTLSKGK